MADLAAGRTAALGDLYQRYGRMVYALLFRYSSGLSGADLEELQQEVFLTLHRTATRYRRDGTLRGWLAGIAIRTARYATSKRRGRLWLLTRFGSGHTGMSLGPEPGAEASDVRILVRRALEKLPASQRDVLILSVWEGLSAEEIAAALSLSTNAVWTRLHRARASLCAVLSREDGSDG